MSIKKSSVRPPVRLSAVLAVVALAAAACGGGASTTEGAPATTGPEGAAAASAPPSSPAGEGGGAVSSPSTSPTTTAPVPVPVPAPTMTDDEYDETIGRELAELDEPAGPPPDSEDQDQTHDHDNEDGHDHDDNGPSDGSEPATGQTPDPAEETETATTVPVVDETPTDSPQQETEPETGDWWDVPPEDIQDLAPELEPVVDAPDSEEVRNIRDYTAHVYLKELVCDPQPEFCSEQEQRWLAGFCVKPAGLFYPGLRIRDVSRGQHPNGFYVWSAIFYRVRAIEDSVLSNDGDPVQYVNMEVDRWNYHYIGEGEPDRGEAEPEEISYWQLNFPNTQPDTIEPWSALYVKVPGGHAQEVWRRGLSTSPNPCESEPGT